MTAANQPLIVPIAHYVGQVYNVADDTVTYDLRGGWSVARLTEPQRTVWTLAHGVPERISEGQRWTRSALAEAAAPYVGDANATAIVTDLLAEDILAEVSPGTPQAIDFASNHRLIPMMLGLGNTKEEPWAWRIGFGNTALVTVSRTVYDTWEWCHLYRSLWDSCRKLAKIRAENTDPVANPNELDPQAILTEILEAFHHLLVTSCAYVDIPFDWGTP